MPKLKIETKVCKHHGETEFVLETRGYHRCKKCRQNNVAAQRRKNKQKLVDLFGSKCFICGYAKYVGALQFHYINPNLKLFGIAANGMSRSFASMVEEAEKCVLLCSNCHAEVEAGIVIIPDGAIGSATPC